MTIMLFEFIMHSMVNKKNKDKNQDDLEITNDNMEITEPDLEEVEAKELDIIKSLREKLKACDAHKREILEESQRAKADFLNAKRRLEEDRLRDRERAVAEHVERLLPLCDSFQMAMSDKNIWEKADESWRKGMEGIYLQLQNLLNGYGVKPVNPVGQVFDPHKHEALSMVPVVDKNQHDKIARVIQMGYEITRSDGTVEQVRPARVEIGTLEDNN